MSDEKPVTPELLKSLTPLEGMKKDNLAALARKVALRTLSPGRLLFKEGERDKRTVWVVSGTVEIREGDKVVGMIRGGSADARNPLCHQQPRRASARALDEIEYLSIDSELLDVMITWDQTGSYEVSDLRRAEGESDDDWMTTLLSSSSFQRIPPSNIQAIFMRMQRQAYRAGEVVIKQGDEGDFFYAIVNGKVVVTRETPLNKDGIRLAELGPGDSFGEEALIAEAKRNATVRMLTDGVLVRLGKNDFRELMNDPLLHYVDEAQAKEIVARGGKWLDVRLPSEFQNLRIEDSLNVPLYFIRLKLGTLQKNTPYVVCCDTGRRSAAAAFILVEKGFDAYVLKGGIAQAQVPLRRSA
ncbi:MAG: cyclic nucleotide-binding domain-containing protein [Steroidobacteraceae bacterium]|jgi:CRP-like cAMP-binding protein|nr:cyclic nucleotide-binding domain-containing protein [Steroidobacteraceae bacterium]